MLRRTNGMWALLRGLWLLCMGAWLLGLGCGGGKTLGGENSPCNIDSDCVGNLKCIGKVCSFESGIGLDCKASKKCPSNLTCVKGFCLFSNGQRCSSQTPCKDDLRCSDTFCLRPVGEGLPCLDSKGCSEGLVCSSQGKCAKDGAPGSKGKKQDCSGDVDCQRGLSCHPDKKVCGEPGSDGWPCEKVEDCTDGLVCSSSGSCLEKGEKGTKGPNDQCKLAEECRKGFTCGDKNVCVEEGKGTQNTVCGRNQDCRADFVCAEVGESSSGRCKKKGEPGTLPLNAACKKTTDCSFGLVCNLQQKCVRFVAATQASCPDPDEVVGPFRVYFEVPRKDRAPRTFYHLPFPNDIRRDDKGKLQLSDHPVGKEGPAKAFQQYLALLGEQVGFGTQSTVRMLFSREIKFSSLSVSGKKARLLLRNLNTGASVSFSALYNPARNRFVCHRNLLVRPTRPLQLGATYAVLVTKGVEDEKGNAIKPSLDFVEMLKDEPPSVPALAAAHKRYQVLRDYLAKNTKESKWPARDDVVAAAVFTTADPRAEMQGLRDALQNTTAPRLKALTLCDGTSTSPCASGNDKQRACKSVPGFQEWHAKVEVPVLLKGKAPYTEGAEIVRGSDGVPQTQGSEEICVSLTVPKGKAPADGWPLLLFAHGENGDFRSHVRDGLAQRLSSISRDGKTYGVAMLGFDQPLHGTRAGKDETRTPFQLRFQVANPHLMANLPRQVATEIFTMIRLSQSLNIPEDKAKGQAAVNFDPKRVAFFGHKQGAEAGLVALPYAPEVKLAMVVGVGGNLSQVWLGQNQPRRLEGELQLLFGDRSIKRGHPLLDLMQTMLDPIDPMNHAALLLKRPLKGQEPKHLYMPLGLSDSTVGEPSSEALGLELGTYEVRFSLPPRKNLTYVQGGAPAKGNLKVGGKPVTSVLVQYKPEGYDGHFVAFRHPDAQRHIRQFLASWLQDKDKVPTLVP